MLLSRFECLLTMEKYYSRSEKFTFSNDADLDHYKIKAGQNLWLNRVRFVKFRETNATAKQIIGI